MATVRTLDTSSELVASAVRSRVAVSDILADEWEDVEHLHCERLDLRAAPQIDQCVMSFVYGPVAQAGTTEFTTYEPLELLGKFCRVTLEGAGQDGDDVVWYGIIEVDDKEVYGSGATSNTVPRGRQTLTAYGLLRLLERVYVRHSWVDMTQDGGLPSRRAKVGIGIPFNVSAYDSPFMERGNRSQNHPVGDATDPYWFSNQPAWESDWSAWDAAEYLLYHHGPTDDGADDPDETNRVCNWTLSGIPAQLNWYDVSVNTDGRSVKSILDELIPARRGVGYVVEFDPTAHDGGFSPRTDRGTCRLRIFTHTPETLTLDAEQGLLLPENDDQVSIDPQSGLDIDVRIVDSVSSKYDRVIVIGALRTSTCTLSLDPGQFQLEAGWTATLEADYLAGASAQAGYSTSDPLEQARDNTKARSQHKFRPVFRRWRLYRYWDGRVTDWEDTTQNKLHVFPKIDEYGNPIARAIEVTATADNVASNAPIHPNSIKFSPRLPLNDTQDFSGTALSDGPLTWDNDDPPEYLGPLILLRTEDTGTPSTDKYENLEVAADQSSNPLIFRRWSAGLTWTSRLPGFDLNVHGAPQHFIAGPAAAAMATLEAFINPMVETSADFRDIRVTVCLESTSHIAYRVDITDLPIEGKPYSTLYINAPDCRLDYLVPSTIVALSGGNPQFADGGWIRDDRARLSAIANAAATWYGKERRSITIDVRRCFSFATIGMLIVDIGTDYQKTTDVNSIVTGITYDLRNQTTHIETSHMELEFGTERTVRRIAGQAGTAFRNASR